MPACWQEPCRFLSQIIVSRVELNKFHNYFSRAFCVSGCLASPSVLIPPRQQCTDGQVGDVGVSHADFATAAGKLRSLTTTRTFSKTTSTSTSTDTRSTTATTSGTSTETGAVTSTSSSASRSSTLSSNSLPLGLSKLCVLQLSVWALPSIVQVGTVIPI